MLHKGKDGKSYANPQVMRHKDAMMSDKKPEMGKPMGMPDSGDEGEDTEIPDQLEAAHEKMGGKHMHIHQGDDGKITVHQHSEMGAEKHDPENLEALKDHMGQFLDEEGQEGGEPQMMAPKHMGMGMNHGGGY